MNSELDPPNRRFFVTSLAARVALVVPPITASTISTDAAGLIAGEVKIPVADGEVSAY